MMQREVEGAKMTASCPVCGNPVTAIARAETAKCTECGEVVTTRNHPIRASRALRECDQENAIYTIRSTKKFLITSMLVASAFIVLFTVQLFSGRKTSKSSNPTAISGKPVAGEYDMSDLSQKKVTAKSQLVKVPEYRELTPSRKFGRTWRAVVVSPSISRSELIALAASLHKDDPTSSVRFFDDTLHYESFRLWDEKYPNPQYPSPEGWSKYHYIALLNIVQSSLGRRWELWAMDGGARYLPPESDGQTIAILE